MEYTTYAEFQANLREFFLERGQFVTLFLWKCKTCASTIQNLSHDVFVLVLKRSRLSMLTIFSTRR